MAVTDFLIPFATMVAVTALVWGVYSVAASGRAEVQQRLGQYGEAQAAAVQLGQTGLPLKDRGFSSIGFIDRLLRGSSYAERIAFDLSRAAVPMRVGEYLLVRWMVACATLLLARLLGLWLPLAVILAVGGYFIPRFWLSQRERARIKRIDDQLVDALTMMANALKSGSSFLQSMEMVSRELPPPISTEFGQVVAEIGVGAQLDAALQDLSRRVRSYDLYLMVTAMTVQRAVGGNLSEVLENIAHTIRERQRLLRQVQVETAEVRMTSYVLIGMPVVAAIGMSMIIQGYIDTLLNNPAGRAILVIAFVLQVIGYFIMRRIADIRV